MYKFSMSTQNTFFSGSVLRVAFSPSKTENWFISIKKTDMEKLYFLHSLDTVQPEHRDQFNFKKLALDKETTLKWQVWKK